MVYKGQQQERIAYRLMLTGDLTPLNLCSVKVAAHYQPTRFHRRYNTYHGSPLTAHTSDQLGFFAIQSIRYVGKQTTFDIAVEGLHNFIAEGIVVHNSEMVYHKTKRALEAQGVIFTDMDTGLRKHPEIVKQYFGTIIPPTDNKFAALNSSVWSGGSFVYVPKGVQLTEPLQAYFRINAEGMGQFERTLIVIDEGAFAHYIEGCTASIYSKDSLHAAVVEIIVKPGGRCRYTTLQNWSNNVYNLVTKRARVEEGATMEWVDFNGGSKLTMKYPSVYLVGRKARGDILSVAIAGPGQHQDTGGKVLCLAPETSGTITAKSVAFQGGQTSYRGLVKVAQGATNSKVHVVCDALLLDASARNDTYPTMKINDNSAQIGHEATVAKIGDDELFYLRSRGLAEAEARSMIVNGFFEQFTRQLPMEYAVEFNRLIELEMEGSVG
ncbi:Fe-S cluster assembly protein SufB [Candidatus Berkelbacteria bacterium]|nr:Fe-S cluster assembly protein SufB [Candidatus Berkelbacteria bacterium]